MPTGASRRPAAFLDRDGVINLDRGYVYRRKNFEFVPGVLRGATELHQLGYLLVVVTNQSGIGRGFYTEHDFAALTEWMKAEFDRSGAPLAAVYFCPHHPTEAFGAYLRSCECRKPAPGMLTAAARDLDIDLTTSVLFGDSESDLEAAHAAGIQLRVLLGTDGRIVPAMPSPSGLASAAYRRLDDALQDPALRSKMTTHAFSR